MDLLTLDKNLEDLEYIESGKDLKVKVFRQILQMLAILTKDVRHLKGDMAVCVEDIMEIKLEIGRNKISPEKLEDALKAMDEIMKTTHAGGERPKDK